MRPSIVVAGCALIASAGLAAGQQPTPNSTSAPKQQQRQQQKQQQKQITPRRVHKQPKPPSSVDGSIQTEQKHPAHQRMGRSGAGQNTTSNAQLDEVRPPYSDALRRYRHERHDRSWWKKHYTIIVLVGGGYYYWDSGYWCPAWGYDPAYQYYDYDGPIYTYGNLLPDQVIANVQRALKELGYYTGQISGALTPATRAAITAYQQDSALEATGAIDAATVAALGLE